jgi:hypothetical protein
MQLLRDAVGFLLVDCEPAGSPPVAERFLRKRIDKPSGQRIGELACLGFCGEDGGDREGKLLVCVFMGAL